MAHDERHGICRACKRAIRLLNREGEHVADEYHNPRLVEVSSEYAGPGRSGLGMWWVRHEYVCDKRR